MARILVVEDEKTQRLVILTMLKANGFEAIGAENGAEGIELARLHTPDLILSDIHMEQGDGYSMLSAIRNDQATATIPVIFITGMADLQVMRQSMQLGADDFIPKPFSQEELLAAVKTRLDKHQKLSVQASKKLEELRASMSITVPHEMRTPLNGILGYSDIMRKQFDDLEPLEVGRMAERIYKNAKRLERLVENYLLYAQMEIQKSDLHIKADLFDAETPHAEKTLEHVALQKAGDFGRSADLELQLSPGRVSVSPKYFSKISEELIDNAFRYSKTGTPVVVRTETRNSLFFFSITDYGRGMTAEQISQIGAFVQFERHIYEQQGQGLGLTVTRRLVELHGGTMEITSEYGHGTTVSVTLP
ncbi:MAG: hybrid sensor histidine kinase/response regulator [Ignavibacteriales bacterium]|nr:hybrid sensor histidine kinase/response regulator [Ignavibacteriales bacterium]